MAATLSCPPSLIPELALSLPATTLGQKVTRRTQVAQGHVLVPPPASVASSVRWEDGTRPPRTAGRADRTAGAALPTALPAQPTAPRDAQDGSASGTAAASSPL